MLRSFFKYHYRRFYQRFHYDTFKTNMLKGKLLAENNRHKKNISSLDEVAFQVFSQRGEDGVLQYIISQVEIPNKIFIELGVEDYTESNTRFLLMNDNWAGLVVDCSKRNIRFIRTDHIYWKYDITAEQAFISTENINQLISDYTSCKDIGLLSIDIDGNDFWVWEAINMIQPRIVVCEYNSLFGPDKQVTIPYNKSFSRTASHKSNLYFGASLAALCGLAERKGYDFIGTTSAGINAFFVRKDLSAPFTKYSSSSGFHAAANREKDTSGELAPVQHEKRLLAIKEMPVIELISGNTYTIKELYQL